MTDIKTPTPEELKDQEEVSMGRGGQLLESAVLHDGMVVVAVIAMNPHTVEGFCFRETRVILHTPNDRTSVIAQSTSDLLPKETQ